MKNSNNRGFSLVELLVAIAIMSIILISIASFASTTTSTYVQTKADVELQADGADVLNLISDKLMQAKYVRIGTTKATQKLDFSGNVVLDGSGNPVMETSTIEYCAYGDHQSAYESVDGELGKNATDKVTGSANQAVVKSFRMLQSDTIQSTSGEQLQYIAIGYDTADVTSASSGSKEICRFMLDVYYFYENGVYLYRFAGEERYSANESYTTKDKTVAELDVWMDGNINSIFSITNMEGEKQLHLVCDTVEYADIYASTDDNSLYINMDFKKKNKRAVNSIQSMVTVRNSYVLQPKNYEIPTTSGGGGSPTPTL